ncbi:YoaK family protein [Mucilaginibacter arboris]|uniref:DUF1275 domain-containing protein n=1 Tax=Mucilaginibacter arboris TaxID=2682090 RepID=A0A7K1ST83_9SPHI|nr:YoaK family protein [Mucilaginibacter arboris]MVN20523.1 DUF1275 domain-containing protein [Mucilaginibacter arboris]
MLRNTKGDRSLKENLMLASSTAFVAGGVNVAGVIAFLAFTSNVTGHVANLAKNIIDKDFKDIRIFFIWLMLFFGGAFLSGFIINSLKHKSNYKAHAIPILVEICILAFVAFYGNILYQKSTLEREIIIGCILFSMGLQNAMVSVISGSLIKSTHLTGLITDMGAELAEWIHPNSDKTVAIKNKLYVRTTILGFYLLGGLAAGYFFNIYKFKIFYFVPVILLTILYYDLSPIIKHKISKAFFI